jgi:hypothetical protein
VLARSFSRSPRGLSGLCATAFAALDAACRPRVVVCPDIVHKPEVRALGIVRAGSPERIRPRSVPRRTGPAGGFRDYGHHGYYTTARLNAPAPSNVTVVIAVAPTAPWIG